MALIYTMKEYCKFPPPHLLVKKLKKTGQNVENIWKRFWCNFFDSRYSISSHFAHKELKNHNIMKPYSRTKVVRRDSVFTSIIKKATAFQKIVQLYCDSLYSSTV